MIKEKVVILISLSLIMLNLAGCNNKVQSQQESGLQVYTLSTALGAVDNTSMDEQKLTYSFNLTNDNAVEVYIKSIEPIISDSIKGKVVNNTISVDVNKDMKPNTTIQLTGELILNTKGSWKSDITQLQPIIKGINVISEQSILVK